MRHSSVLIYLIAVCIFSGCNGLIGERGNGVVITQSFEVQDFDRISVEGTFEIRLEKSEQPSVVITTDENLMDFIVVESGNGRVKLVSEKNLISDEGVKVVIGYTSLKGIFVGGAAVLTSDETITQDYLNIEMSGAGAVELDLDLTALEINVSGAGAMELTGRVVEQRISMSGAGGLDAEDLISEKCGIEISGVGGASIHVTERLKASVSGVGGITYRGNPTDVQKDVSGIGTIEAEN